MDVESRICGIPCLIQVDSHVVVEPWKGRVTDCPSDMDYHGYCETEFTVFDRKGYKAPWLEKKMTEEDVERILEDINNHYSE